MHGEGQQTFIKDARGSFLCQGYKTRDPVGQKALALRSGGAVTIQCGRSGMFCSSDGENRVLRPSFEIEHEENGSGG
jgi:hypothetical protein